MILGLVPPDLDRDDSRSADFDTFMEEVDRNVENGWKERLRATVLDIRCGFYATTTNFYSHPISFSPNGKYMMGFSRTAHG